MTAIRDRRKALGWSQDVAARRALVARQTWSRAERGRHVSAISLRRIAAALGLPDEALRP